MTNEEISNGVGQLVTRYADNEKQLAILLERLRDWSKRLTEISTDIMYPKRVTILERPSFEISGHTVTVDGGELWDTLDQYHSALQAKKEFEESIEQAGLGILKKS